MDEPTKLPLVQQSLNLLTDELREKDKVAIVVMPVMPALFFHPLGNHSYIDNLNEAKKVLVSELGSGHTVTALY